jgi:hypothetical protein
MSVGDPASVDDALPQPFGPRRVRSPLVVDAPVPTVEEVEPVSDQPPIDVDPDAETLSGYGKLLGLVLVAIIVPLAVPDGLLTLIAIAGLQGAAILVGLGVSHASRRRRRQARVAVVVMGLAVAGGVGIGVGLGLEPAQQLDLARVIGLLLAFLLIAIIGIDVARQPRITMQMVWAGLAVYLLLGMAYAYAHGLISSLVDGAYTSELGFNNALYLSFVTLTTVGFGDVTPVAELAQAVIVSEAILGQLYLVSVIALLVGNLGRSRPARSGR